MKTCSSCTVIYVGPVKRRTYRTIGQNCDAVALGDAPNDFETVREKTTDEDGLNDAVKLADPERDRETVKLPVLLVEPLRLLVTVTDGVNDLDIDTDADAPNESETVEEAV